METIKHECGVALIRLLKPLSYYKEKYGTWGYGFNKLYLLMEKQHNRGQEAAGFAALKMQARLQPDLRIALQAEESAPRPRMPPAQKAIRQDCIPFPLSLCLCGRKYKQ